MTGAGSVVLYDNFCQPRSAFPFGGRRFPFVEDPVWNDFGQRLSAKETFEAGVERVVCATEFLAARGVHLSVWKVSVRHGEVPAGLGSFHEEEVAWFEPDISRFVCVWDASVGVVISSPLLLDRSSCVVGDVLAECQRP